MQFSTVLKSLLATCLAVALILQGFSAGHSAMAATMGMNSVVGDLSDFSTYGGGGTLDIEKNGQTMHFSFGSGLTINGKPYTSWGMRSEEWGASIPSVLKLHCTLVRVYYNGSTATALKTISNGGSRYFC